MTLWPSLNFIQMVLSLINSMRDGEVCLSGTVIPLNGVTVRLALPEIFGFKNIPWVFASFTDSHHLYLDIFLGFDSSLLSLPQTSLQFEDKHCFVCSRRHPFQLFLGILTLGLLSLIHHHPKLGNQEMPCSHSYRANTNSYGKGNFWNK